MAYQQYSGVFTNTQTAQAKGQDKWVSTSIVIPGDDEITNTTLLLQANGSDGDTNNGFIDSSDSTHTITRNGNVTQGSFSPFSQDEGKWGISLPAANSRMYTGSSSDFNLSTNDFCYEGWFWINDPDVVNYPRVFGLGPYYNDTNSFGVILHDLAENDKVTVYWNDGSLGRKLISSTTVPANQWCHIAVVRSGSNYGLFLNGTRIATYTSSNAIGSGNRYAFIGSTDNGSGSEGYVGYVSNVRLVNGSSVYDPTQTSITVPTGPLTAITNTVLLTGQSNRFVDNSSSAHSFTLANSPEVAPFSPFAPSTAYDPATKGGSGYFDGSGDYLSIPDSPDWDLGSGDWTIDFWVYLNSTATQSLVSYQWENTSTGGRILAIYINSGQWVFLTRITTGHVATPVIPYQWNHVRLVRSGATTYGFINGKLESTASALNYGTSSYGIQLGCSFSQSTPVNFLNGYMSDVRIIRGVGLTTTDFTLPTAPVTSDSNTTLLCNFTNAGIYDGTGRNVLETVGDAQVDTAVKKFGTGSMQFDGTGDGLLMSANPQFYFGTGDYTIEGWVYIDSFAIKSQRLHYRRMGIYRLFCY